MTERPALAHDDFAAFAHELRGALTVIAGYAQLLRRPLPPGDSDSALDGIERAIHRIDTLCADALAGRPPTSPNGVAFESVSLAELAEQVATDQRFATGRVVNVSTCGGSRILGDADALARVLGNLIDNAAKYSLTSAPIDVSVADKPSATLPTIVVEVGDRGPGIDPDEVERLLEPYARLDRDAERPGSGLGLSIVRDVVAAHSGRLNILERTGGGTVVRIEFPAE